MSEIAGNDLLAQIENENPKLGIYLRTYLKPAVEQAAKNAAVAPGGSMVAPAPPDQVIVKASGETVHVSIVHKAPIIRNIRYFTEIDNYPSFPRPLIYDHGTSRTPPPFTLPTFDDNGDLQTWYFQSYAQYPGSPPSAKTKYGPGITLGGFTNLTLLTSQGSGTAKADGTQGGYGLGVAPVRL